MRFVPVFCVIQFHRCAGGGIALYHICALFLYSLLCSFTAVLVEASHYTMKLAERAASTGVSGRIQVTVIGAIVVTLLLELLLY